MAPTRRPRNGRPQQPGERSVAVGIAPGSGGALATAEQLKGRRQGTTGRFLVLLPEEGTSQAATSMKAEGMRFAVSSDFETAPPTAAALAGADALVLEDVGVAVVTGEPKRAHQLAARVSGVTAESAGPLVEPERYVYAIAMELPEPRLPAPTRDYLLGYRNAVVGLVDGLLQGRRGPAPGVAEPAAAAGVDESQVTWGLQAIGVPASQYTGAGVKLAILDTGIAPAHPDFAGRAIVKQSFVPGESPDDGHGHGTHCAGTAAGTATPARAPRYGVAPGAVLHVGKVLGDGGSGADGGILAGIDWALKMGCAVISMSLGAAVQPGEPYSRVFETVARRALRRGTIIVAAAGNESRRAEGVIAPVGHPANCPSILAVAAVDSDLQVADFSCAGTSAPGGQVDVAGPGVRVYSTWPVDGYRRISGTSMATPHVAGIAALLAEASGHRGAALWGDLVRTARRLPLPSTDAGAGLVQAPRA